MEKTTHFIFKLGLKKKLEVEDTKNLMSCVTHLAHMKLNFKKTTNKKKKLNYITLSNKKEIETGKQRGEKRDISLFTTHGPLGNQCK